MKVWTCKIVVADDAKLPMGFDYPPRRAAIEAVEAHGIEVLSCFSGWGGELTEMERKVMEEKGPGVGGVVVAGQRGPNGRT